MKELLELRNRRNKKKPAFVRKDTHIKAKVKANWRKPRGKHSPVREQHKGRPKLVSPGYGAPKAVRHLHHSGLKIVQVKNLVDLDNINPEKEGVMLAKTTGIRKRIEVIKIALEKKLTILNLKEPQQYLDTLAAEFKKRQESKKKKLTEKEKKEEEKKKKATEKEEKDKKVEAKKEKSTEKEEKVADEKKETPIEKEKVEKKKIEKTLIKKQ